VRIAAAILAAGAGSRLGGDVPKPLVELAGRPLVAWALDAVMATDLRPVVLVVGWRGRGVEDAAPPGVTVVHARSWKEGIAHSLHAAVDTLGGYVQVDAVCIGLADQPRVGPEAYRRLAAAHETGAELAVATYDGTRQNPVLVGRSLWPAARALRGDVGAKALMADREVVEVDCTGTGDARDVDTLDDLRALEQEMGNA
jgi:molybdenum cofactor cytidylyltransferase